MKYKNNKITALLVMLILLLGAPIITKADHRITFAGNVPIDNVLYKNGRELGISVNYVDIPDDVAPQDYAQYTAMNDIFNDAISGWYIIDYWALDYEGVTPFSANALLTDDVTVYARWKRKSGIAPPTGNPGPVDYTKLAFRINKPAGATGSFYPDEDIEMFDNFPDMNKNRYFDLYEINDALAAPTADNYLFTGWYTDAACTNALDPNDIFNPNLENDGIPYEVFAGWLDPSTAETHRITFAANLPDDGASLYMPGATNHAIPQNYVNIPNGIAPSNYAPFNAMAATFDAAFDVGGEVGAHYWSFNSWTTDYTGLTPFASTVPLTANVTVYAKWTQGGVNHVIPGPGVSVYSEFAARINKPSDATGSFTPNADIEIFNTFPANAHRYFDFYAINDALATPIADNYTFVDWYTDAALTNLLDPGEIFNPYGVWGPGGYGSDPRTPYEVFAKWTGKVIPVNPHITARLKSYSEDGPSTAETHRITFAGNVPIDNVLYESGSRELGISVNYVDIPDGVAPQDYAQFTAMNDIFNDAMSGWYIIDYWALDYEGVTPFSESALLTDDVTVYARWKDKDEWGPPTGNPGPVDYTKLAVRINKPAGATGSFYPDEDIEMFDNFPDINKHRYFDLYEINDALAAPTADNYLFTGWYTDAACTNTLDPNDIFNPNLENDGIPYEVFAGWTEPETHRITFAGNVPIDNVLYKTGRELGISVNYVDIPNGVAPQNYAQFSAMNDIFNDAISGWYIIDYWALDYEGVTSFSESALLTDDVTVYARWKRKGGIAPPTGNPGPVDYTKLAFRINKPAGATGSFYPDEDIEMFDNFPDMNKNRYFDLYEINDALAAPAADNYVFTGWYTDAACTNALDPNDIFNPNLENDGIPYEVFAGWLLDP